MLIAGAGYEMATSDVANKYMRVAGKMMDESAKKFLGEDKWNELMSDKQEE